MEAWLNFAAWILTDVLIFLGWVLWTMERGAQKQMIRNHEYRMEALKVADTFGKVCEALNLSAKSIDLEMKNGASDGQ